MLTYTPTQDNPAAHSVERPWMLLLLCFFWLWPGIFGHDPWKPDEGYVVGVVQSMLEDGHWLVPTIAGVPYLDASPLYYWVAAGFAGLLRPVMPLADGMRLATPLFMALALWFAGLAGRDLIGYRHGRSAAMLLLGALGLMLFGHSASPDVASFAAMALALWALSRARTQGWLAGALLGLASGALALSSSVVGAGLVWLVALLLPVFRAWRTPEHAKTWAVGLTVGLPLVLVWPLALAQSSPLLFDFWLHQRALGVFHDFSGAFSVREFGYYLEIFPWFALPLWPLAVWTLWRRRGHWQTPVIQLPLLMVAVISAMLFLSPVKEQELALPLLIPLAVLAAVELDGLRRGAAAFFNWFGLMTFGLIAAFLWVGWAAMNFGWPARLAQRAHFFNPDYVPQISVPLLLLALVATGVWIWAVTRRHMGGRKAATNWAAGVTLIWSLAASLWLPWIDGQKSYRKVFESLAVSPLADACMVTDVSLSLIALARYHGGVVLRPLDSAGAHQCRHFFTMRDRDAVKPVDPLWQGLRSGDRKEFYYVLEAAPGR
ncbi:ArnT family glycosyltransferase [Laribacter hongkongensis]|uniref:ArnT family glycosyltransferase n=1 Tax=Laribacter hongkongensis TaxID=168471 RepID=UPI001EFD4776|nr:glycosyltransferase family 39 protein [Laribacter hongkongensis]MCG9077411.1 glycosyltransferase family 39 protein [Laribacter hongkongensis]